MKKLFTILTLMVLATSTFAYDFSAICPSGQTLYYTILSLSEKTVELTYYDYYYSVDDDWETYYYGVAAPCGDLIIPETVQYQDIQYTVTAVGTDAFRYCDLTSVVFPNTITIISAGAFFANSGNPGLIGELVLPENLQTIGNMAFWWNTRLTAVSIPNTVKEIGQDCFNTCVNLTHLTIGSGVEELNYLAFNNCHSLDTIIIKTLTPPTCQWSTFRYVPKNIPVFVPFGTKERYEQTEYWNEFTNYIETYEIVPGTEWYYEILNDNGSITYQHLEYASDTIIGTQRPKVIVRSNTQYDRDTITEVTHEYIYEEGNMVYWWNKDLEEFTLLYDYNAETGDEWEIKVGTESITVHVDGVDIFEYDGDTFKRLYISDVGNIFNGEIVVGFGHMTSFFPEKLMNQGKGFRVNGLRCYWVEEALLYHNGEEDCDAIHSELQEIVEPMGDATFAVYPNPTNNVLFVETRLIASLPGSTAYRITNLMGQTVLSGNITTENQQIDITNLAEGMYFITVGGQTVKFVVK